MRFIFFLYLILAGATWSRADNLLPEGDFHSSSVGTYLDLTNSINPTGIPGWRCFTSVALARMVHFEIVQEDGAHAMLVKMVANPKLETSGRIGFDIDQAKLTVTPGERLKLTFDGKQISDEPCAVMITISGQNAAGGVISEYPQSLQLSPDFTPITARTYTVPDGATRLNVVLNLMANTGYGMPLRPCGMEIKNLDLEKLE